MQTARELKGQISWLPVLLMSLGLATAFGQGLRSAASGTDPCGGANDPVLFSADGLSLVQGGQIVYDSKEGLCWLADANLAGNPYVRAAVTLAPMNPDGSKPVINPDGTMNYETAVNWVQSLNRYNGGNGWLNHNQWQLPANPATDPTCSSFNNANFGIQCTGSPTRACHGPVRGRPRRARPRHLQPQALDEVPGHGCR